MRDSPLNQTTEEKDNGNKGLFKKIVDFLMGEYISQRNENLDLKGKRSSSKQKDSDCVKNCLNLKETALNPGKNSWKKRGGKKRISLSSKSNSKGTNSNLEKNSFTLRRKNAQKEENYVEGSNFESALFGDILKWNEKPLYARMVILSHLKDSLF